MSVALRVADRIAVTGGPRAGLSVYRLVAEKTNDGETRGRALLSALRCAVALSDWQAADELIGRWDSVSAGLFSRDVAALVKKMPLVHATKLAHAEVRRHVTAHALYTYARCLDVAGDARAVQAFADAIARAEREGAEAIVTASRLRRVAWLARSLGTLEAALEEASKLDLGKLGERDRVAVARVMLCSPSRFVRATALSFLDPLSCARHAEAMGDALTPLEADRVLAALKPLPEVREAVRALDRIAREPDLDAALRAAAEVQPELAPLHVRARDVLAGRFEPRRETPDDPWSLLLEAAVGLRDADHGRAIDALHALGEREKKGRWSPPQVWTIAEAALDSSSTDVREAAARLVSARMDRGISVPPPRGWLGLAERLAASGFEKPAELARRAAYASKEPRAAAELALSLTRSGWALARSGERSSAVACLREARAVAEKSAGANPSR